MRRNKVKGCRERETVWRKDGEDEEEARLDGRRRAKKKTRVVKCRAEWNKRRRQMRKEEERHWRHCDLTCSAAMML